ncbi:MAG: LUD domain-containing protein [Chitinophagaceae bacterium]|nr:LUD domain-containing protein [Chitinophagaceae bacterium]
MSNTSKENILKRIQQALKKPVPVPFSASVGDASTLYQPSSQELEIEFAENFTKLQGRFSYCANETELVEQLQTLATQRKWTKIFCCEEALKNMLAGKGLQNINSTDLATCEASITYCEQLVARTGSMLLSSGQASGRTVSVYAPIHICIAYTDQLVYDVADSLNSLLDKYRLNLPSLITLASGPSRTADIEKTLVVGVHGPKEVFCFLLDRQ